MPGTLWNGTPAPYAEEDCPRRGMLVNWGASHQLDGRHGDAGTLYCSLCGAAVRQQPYPEEGRLHLGGSRA